LNDQESVRRGAPNSWETRMSEGKVKAAKVKVYPLPEGASGADGQFHVYIYDVFNKTFHAGKSFDNVERAAQHQRHHQEHIYLEQEADPELFDLPFISADPALLERIQKDENYRKVLMRDLTGEARSRGRKR
jgi:hypothetical protein